MSKSVPRRAGIDVTDAAALLRAALDATGRNQTRLAEDVLGAKARSVRDWLAGEPCWQPIMRLAWVLARHPELADEIDAAFNAD